jgi:phospholipid/cholesterol/gamma-HCH transport system ATP-binding protein
MNAIEITDLKKTFNGKDFVVNGLNLAIEKGSLTAIIGFSGTGKSVMLKHILGLFRPTSGHIKVMGEEITTMTEHELTLMRRRFGVLFQGAALFDDMNVIENVCFPLFEHKSELGRARILEIAKKKLIEVGLEEKHFVKLPSEISGGMQKRTGLARALALDPEILFYDEPTTGLDPILTEMVDNLILDTHRNSPGLTSVMISHDLSAAFRLADKIAMLNAGQVLLHGTPEEFMKTDIELIKKFVAKGLKH